MDTRRTYQDLIIRLSAYPRHKRELLRKALDSVENMEIEFMLRELEEKIKNAEN